MGIELADQILETQSHLFKSENFHEDVTNMLLDIFLSNQQIGVWFLSNHTTGAGEKRIHDFSKEICINEWRNHKTMSELQLNLFYEYYYAGAMAFLKTWYHSGLLEDVEGIRKEFIEITGLTIQYIFG